MMKFLRKYWPYILGLLVGLALFLYWYIGRGSKKADRSKTLRLEDPYMRGKEVCKLQEYLRSDLDRPNDPDLSDCIFGPVTKSALVEATGSESASLSDLGI